MPSLQVIIQILFIWNLTTGRIGSVIGFSIIPIQNQLSFVIPKNARTTERLDRYNLRPDVFVVPKNTWCLYATIKNDNNYNENDEKKVTISDTSSTTNDNMNFVTKASWYAVEAFGNVFGKSLRRESNAANEVSTNTNTITIDTTKAPQSIEETYERIRIDNDREYFLSGQIDELIYDPDCLFADPFVSFRGRDRFITNLQNLGSFITKYSAKPITYDTTSTTVQTKFMVKLELNLPWKPVLAWPWGVKCSIDPTTNLIVVHEESWDIEPWEGVKQIFRKPTVKI